MGKFIYDTYKDNPPEGEWVMATVRLDQTEVHLEMLAVYTEDSNYPRDYIDGPHGKIGTVEKWRFLNKEEKELYGK